MDERKEVIGKSGRKKEGGAGKKSKGSNGGKIIRKDSNQTAMKATKS
jgi:hypothetical protein